MFKFKYPTFENLPFSSMQTNSNSIRMGTQRNPWVEEIDVWFIKSKPYGAWAVRIKREKESPQTAFFRDEEIAHRFAEYIDTLAAQEREKLCKATTTKL